MTLVACGECREQISSTAKTCPKCGAKVPRTKWWLWIPLGIFAVLLISGLTEPEYKTRAYEVREACEKAFPLRRDDCRSMYYSTISEAEANHRRSKGYEAPVDRQLVERTSKAREAEDKSDLADCRDSLGKKRDAYADLMRRKQYWDASLALRICADAMNDAELKQLVADAEIKQYTSDLDTPGVARDVQRRSLEALRRDYPDAAKRYARR